MIDRAEVLRRVEQWLDATLADEASPPGIPPEILSGEAETEEGQPGDLHSMWGAITALTQEVRLQGRAFKQLSETVGRDGERRGSADVLDGLLDIRERLLRGLESVRTREEIRPDWLDRIFRRRWDRIRHALDVAVAMEEGYRLALQRLDDLLHNMDVSEIVCDGRTFDPRRMNAADVTQTEDVPEGTVMAVYRTGYEWNGEVYRPAQVRVAQRPRGVAINE